MSAREDMQNKYAEARANGVPGKEAILLSGYSPKSEVADLEKPGSAIHNKIIAALKAKGITEDYIAKEYASGIEESGKDGAREKDLNAKAQFLKQLGFLMGYGKQNPSVAVQINNTNGSSPEVDPSRAGELLSEITGLLKVLKEDFGHSERSGVHEGSIGTEDSNARSGVVEPATKAKPSGGRGKS